MLPKLPCLPPNRDNNFTRAVRTGKVSSSSHAQIRKTRVIADVTAERGHVAIPTIRFAHDYRNTPVSPLKFVRTPRSSCKFIIIHPCAISSTLSKPKKQSQVFHCECTRSSKSYNYLIAYGLQNSVDVLIRTLRFPRRQDVAFIAPTTA